MASLRDLSVDDVCAEIAGLQWEIVIETAQAAYHAPKEDRTREYIKLRDSESILDRYAAALVKAWQAEARP